MRVHLVNLADVYWSVFSFGLQSHHVTCMCQSQQRNSSEDVLKRYCSDPCHVHVTTCLSFTAGVQERSESVSVHCNKEVVRWR